MRSRSEEASRKKVQGVSGGWALGKEDRGKEECGRERDPGPWGR